MAIARTVVKVLIDLIVPWAVLTFKLVFLPKTIKQFIDARDYSGLFSPTAFGRAWFGNFWATVGPEVKRSYGPDVQAILEGRMVNGRVQDVSSASPMSGVVLEIGAGGGAWLDVYAAMADAQASTESRITKIYGVEPNSAFSASLRQQVVDLDLSDIYEVVAAGVEQVVGDAYWRGKIPEGSVDSIVSICCLCSIPDPEKNIKLLYKLLRPGGRWYIHEHGRTNRGGPLMLAYQCKSMLQPGRCEYHNVPQCG